MGGSPARIIKKTITRGVGGGGVAKSPSATSQIEDRRTEVKKTTEPEGKKLVRRKVSRKRKSNRGSSLITSNSNLGDTNMVRNPRDTGKKTLGA
jgi:hypothetical protein